MRFPLALTSKIAKYIVGKKLRGTKKFATVLQLEPLHTCNLTCTGCGRIREYSTSLKDVMSLEDCLGAATECGAPMVSICGGEPLIYPQIEALSTTPARTTRSASFTSARTPCSCAARCARYLAREFGRSPQTVETKLAELQQIGVMTEKEAAEVRKGPKDAAAPVMAPHPFFFWNVHLDGLEYTHDLIVEREGVFKECILAMRMAKILGYKVATNTTIYKETDMTEIEGMLDFLSDFGVDGHTISPGYEYDAAKADMVKRLNLQPGGFLPDPRGHAREVQGPDRNGATATRCWARRSTTSSSWASANWNAPPGPSPRATSPAGGGRATSWRARGISRPTRKCSRTWTGASSASNPARARRATRVARTA